MNTLTPLPKPAAPDAVSPPAWETLRTLGALVWEIFHPSEAPPAKHRATAFFAW
ncbi:MAG: hypothetical protein V4672_10380 [Verrucomicrobiota bacterium]